MANVYTIGHSDRAIDEFLEILRLFNIDILVDIRRWPQSRRYPHYNMGSLQRTLEDVDIAYVWMGDKLGGYRRFGVDVEDIGIARCLQSEGFRAYATYILNSSEALESLETLYRLAIERRVGIMCSERLVYRCHRKIVSDWLYAKGLEVIHIFDRDRYWRHRLTSCARIEDGRLKYV